MTHKSGDDAALGIIRYRFAALYIDSYVFDNRISDRTGKNRSAVSISVCVYRQIFYYGSAAYNSEYTLRVNGAGYRTTVSVERTAESEKSVDVLPVDVVSVVYGVRRLTYVGD